jgi:Tfp pilus assembly protein PilE
MQINVSAQRVQRAGTRGFNLVEAMLGFAILGIFIITVFTAFSSGVSLLRWTRQDQRATQLLLEKMEVIRLYNWDNLTTPGYVPADFTAPFYDTNTPGSLVYTGTVTIAAAPVASAYSNNMRLVTVTVSWMSGAQLRQRQMSTLVARYGMQNYVY